MCYKDAGTRIYIYCKKLDLSTSLLLLLHWEQFLNLKWSYNIPLSEIMIHSETIYWGCGRWCIAIKFHGQSGSAVPRSPGSGILVPCGHSQIFVAAQVWHGMSQTLVLGHSSGQLAWQGQLDPVSSELPVLQVQQMWAACMVQVQGMQVMPLRSGG